MGINRYTKKTKKCLEGTGRLVDRGRGESGKITFFLTKKPYREGENYMTCLWLGRWSKTEVIPFKAFINKEKIEKKVVPKRRVPVLSLRHTPVSILIDENCKTMHKGWKYWRTRIQTV